MKSERIPTRAAARAAGTWLIATLLLLSPVAALGKGTEDECGAAEPCAVMSPQSDSSLSAGARRTARDRASSVRVGDRRAPRKVSPSKKVAPSTPTLVATDASIASVPTGELSLEKGRTK
jgi:hypothetical protein